MDWFLYDNDLRHERVKAPVTSFSTALLKSWNANVACFYGAEDKGFQKLPNWDHSFWYVSKIFQKLNISYALISDTHP